MKFKEYKKGRQKIKIEKCLGEIYLTDGNIEEIVEVLNETSKEHKEFDSLRLAFVSFDIHEGLTGVSAFVHGRRMETNKEFEDRIKTDWEYSGNPFSDK